MTAPGGAAESRPGEIRCGRVERSEQWIENETFNAMGSLQRRVTTDTGREGGESCRLLKRWSLITGREGIVDCLGPCDNGCPCMYHIGE